jgi:hypothetical protein
MELQEILKQVGLAGIFLVMLWKLWQQYTTQMEKIVNRYDDTVRENTKVITLAVDILEHVAKNGHDSPRA